MTSVFIASAIKKRRKPFFILRTKKSLNKLSKFPITYHKTSVVYRKSDKNQNVGFNCLRDGRETRMLPTKTLHFRLWILENKMSSSVFCRSTEECRKVTKYLHCLNCVGFIKSKKINIRNQNCARLEIVFSQSFINCCQET